MPASDHIVQLQQENARLGSELASVKQQLDWLKRQLFGEKSEKRLDIDPAVQGNLLAQLGVEPPPTEPPETETITYQRRKKNRDGAMNDIGLRSIGRINTLFSLFQQVKKEINDAALLRNLPDFRQYAPY